MVREDAGSDMMHARGVTLIAVLALVLWAGAAAASEFEGDSEAASETVVGKHFRE